MYEQPKVTVVGEINDVVLGIASLGSDLDETLVIGPFEFIEDCREGEDYQDEQR